MSEITSIAVIVKQIAERFVPGLNLEFQGEPVEVNQSTQLHVLAQLDDAGRPEGQAVHVFTQDDGNARIGVLTPAKSVSEKPRVRLYQTHLSEFRDYAYPA